MKHLQKIFTETFATKPTLEIFSPGRINLIGEHTDYNGGYVFPAAITIGIRGLARPRTDDKVRVYSTNFSDLGVLEFSIHDNEPQKNLKWANYVLGMLQAFKQQRTIIPHGFDLVIMGEIPNGAGLSSSASLEMLIGMLLKELYAWDIRTLDLVKAGQWTENKFMGVNSGIMDQFAIAFGVKDMGIFLNSNTLVYEMVPVTLGEYKVVIMNTNKRRELSDSHYNERRQECEYALKQLQTKLTIKTLTDLTVSTLAENRNLLENETLLKRARHVVSENDRTLLAKEALQKGNLAAFGTLLNKSHESLQHDYEVTGIELDTLTYTAQQQAGVLGARMTGAGFGGCAIALVKESAIDTFIKNVGTIYHDTIGYAADFYVAEIGSGTTVLQTAD